MRKLTIVQWQDAVKSGAIQDISSELPDEFLLFGQTMRAKVVFEGKKYYASHFTRDQFVGLSECRCQGVRNLLGMCLGQKVDTEPPTL